MAELSIMVKSSFVFELGQCVWIPGAQLDGVIQQILFNSDGVQYQVSYWYEHRRLVEWCFTHEIAPLVAPTIKV